MVLRDLLGNEISEAEARRMLKRKGTRPNGYAAPPGSGPTGETCKTCRHIYRVETGSGRTFRKCALIKATAGAGTDILAKAPACRRWERPSPKDQPQ